VSVCPESLIYIQKDRRLQTQRQETVEKKERKSGIGGGGCCCEINNRTIIHLDATRSRAGRRCWVSYRHCYMLQFV